MPDIRKIRKSRWRRFFKAFFKLFACGKTSPRVKQNTDPAPGTTGVPI